MISYIFVGITLLTALYSLYIVRSAGNAPLANRWPVLLMGISLGLLIYLYGPWVYISIYLKYVFGVAFLLSLLSTIFKKKPAAFTAISPFRRGINLFSSTVMLLLCTLYFTGIEGKPKEVQLHFPLKTGKYFVLQGGKGLPANLFHYSYRGAIYAMDIAKLNSWGNRANSIFSDKLEDYNIYGDTIYSPCDGRIITMHDDNPDNIPPNRERGPSNTNMVVIQNDSVSVFIGHIKAGGVLVRERDVVSAGQPIGLVGNSGFTLEPHLHIQVHENTNSGKPWYQEEPLYISFDGNTYLLFETILPKKVKMIPH